MHSYLTIHAFLATLILLIFTPQSLAQNSTTSGSTTPSTSGSSTSASGSTPPDVFLNVPNLSVGYIELDVEGLQADINLNANVANLVNINAGVAVSLQKLNLTISDVFVQLELVVRLNNLVNIVERVFDTLDSNPQLITGLLNSTTSALGSAVSGVGSAAGGVASGVGSVVGGATSAVGGVVSGATGVVGGATSAVGGAVSGATGAAGSAVSGVTSAAGAATGAAGSVTSAA